MRLYEKQKRDDRRKHDRQQLLGVDEVAETFGVSRSYAYRVIRKLNNERQESGHYVVPGKANQAFHFEKLFGIPERQADEEQEDQALHPISNV